MVGKLLERILRDRIYSHLEINGRISERQHGFVKGRSCLTNLIEFFEEVTKVIDEGRQWMLCTWTSVKPLTRYRMVD